jgi:hypothetical protein
MIVIYRKPSKIKLVEIIEKREEGNILGLGVTKGDMISIGESHQEIGEAGQDPHHIEEIDIVDITGAIEIDLEIEMMREGPDQETTKINMKIDIRIRIQEGTIEKKRSK